MFQGLRTVCYRVTDITQAKEWYQRVVGYGPYFDEPFYVGFNVAGYELGLVPVETRPDPAGAGAELYWGVPDIEQAHRRLLELGAAPHTDIQDVGGDIKVATVTDPFGNVLGIIQNPGFTLAEG